MSSSGGEEPVRGANPVGRVAAIAVVALVGAAGLLAPGAVLRGGVAWLVFLFAVASGWGFIVARVARVDEPDLGLRAGWGLAGYLAVAGALTAMGVCTAPVVLVLIAIGAAGFAWRELVTPVPIAGRLRAAWRSARTEPAIAVLAAVLIALALANLVGAVAMLDRNPWDDDLAYTPLVKRLLDAGNLIEPFSFRRLGAYGGHTALEALAGVRGTLANVHLIDRGLCQAIALACAAGYAREKRTQAVYVIALGLVVLLLPDIAINTAAAWSGVVLFLALYRTVERRHWGLVGLVAAAACTLRQNYIAVVVLFVALALIASRRDGGWRGVRARCTTVVAVGFVAILGWWIAAYRSSGTWLFPLIDGTWNHGLSIKPVVMTWADELGYVLWSAVESSPLVIVPVLFAVLCITRDRRLGRPLPALFVGTVLGFLLLVHGFAGTDPHHLWRYAFGFSIALTIVLVVEAGAADENADVALAPLGRWLLLAALVLQVLVGRAAIPKHFAELGADLREAAVMDRHGDPAGAAEAARYHALQESVPAGERLLVMLDDPWRLDFRRNRIANLDTPGFASPGGQLPAFAGADAMRTYLLAQGYRYVAFVRSERSRYFFRRGFWVWRLFNDGELFSAMSAYTIDAIDDLAALAKTATVLYDADGLVALDLGSGGAVAPQAAPGTEAERRDAFVAALADREGLHDAWTLTTRADLRFEDGVAGLVFVDGAVDDPAWYEIARPSTPQPLRGKATRAIYRRAHLRVRGTGARVLSLRAQIALATTYTHPRIDVSLDGALLASLVADASGHYAAELVVPAAALADGGWHDLYLVSSTAAEPEKDARDLRTTRLELVEWRPVP